MKRIVVILVLGLLGRIVDASLLYLPGDFVAPSTAATEVAALAHDDCGTHHSPQDSDTPNGHHTLPNCHACCGTLGLHFSMRSVPVASLPRMREAGTLAHFYPDITYAIDKPPKAVA